MAHKAKEEEERLLEGEQALSAEIISDSFPLLKTIRAIYLGGNPNKTVRLKGQVLVERIADPDNLEGEPYEVKRQVPEGYTMYDFSKVDAVGRRQRVQMTKDGRRWQAVEHMDHILLLFEMKDADKSPMFEVKASPEELRIVRRYMELKRRRVNPDSGIAVLRDMGLA